MPVITQESEKPPAYDGSGAGDVRGDKAEKSVDCASTLTGSPARSDEMLVCCISIHSTDKLRMVGMPDQYWDGLRKAMEKAWPQGIQREKWVDAAREVKLNGNPWEGEGENSIQCRRLVIALICFLESRGWALDTASCLNRKSSAKDSLLFHRASETPTVKQESEQLNVCAISFNMNDRVRVIDVPASVADVVKGIIEHDWRHGMEKERWFNGVPEYKLNGNPWNSEGDETVQANFLIAKLARALRAAGWKIHASVGVTNCKEGRDLDTWILKRISA